MLEEGFLKLPQALLQFNSIKMKLTFHVLFVILISVSACEKTNLKANSNSISFTVDGETQKFKNVTVEETTFYELLYPQDRQFKVYGTNDQVDDKLAIFYFVQKGNSVFLHSIQLNSISEPKGFFTRDLTDSDFTEKVTVSTKKTGNKVVCNFSAKFTFQNKTNKLLTDGICEFDLEGIQ